MTPSRPWAPRWQPSRSRPHDGGVGGVSRHPPTPAGLAHPDAARSFQTDTELFQSLPALLHEARGNDKRREKTEVKMHISTTINHRIPQEIAPADPQTKAAVEDRDWQEISCRKKDISSHIEKHRFQQGIVPAEPQPLHFPLHSVQPPYAERTQQKKDAFEDRGWQEINCEKK